MFGRQHVSVLLGILLVLLALPAASYPGRGNGRAISNYLTQLRSSGARPSVIRREKVRAEELGGLLYGSGWAEGARRSGLGVALKHGLAFNQVRAVQYWTKGRICDVINPILRAGQPLPKEHQYLNKQLKGALSRLPPYNATVYRGTSVPVAVLYKLEPGGVFVDKAFMSATKTKAIASQFMPPPKADHRNVLFIINSRQGRDISLVGWHGELREVLFAPGAKLRVASKKVENGVLTIRLKDHL